MGLALGLGLGLFFLDRGQRCAPRGRDAVWYTGGRWVGGGGGGLDGSDGEGDGESAAYDGVARGVRR